MKNLYYEHTMRLIKRNSHHHRFFKDGVYCHHSFKYEKEADLTWWADFGFMLNNRYISVDWIHPRMRYYDLIEAEAHQQVQHLQNDCDLLTGEGTPTYRRVGQSRKKIKYYTMEIPESTWFDAFNAVKQQLSMTADYAIEPRINIEWYPYCRSLSICAPVEIRSYQDVVTLSRIIKRILKHEISLEEAFNQPVYTRADWLKDTTSRDVEGLNIHAHTVQS